MIVAFSYFKDDFFIFSHLYIAILFNILRSPRYSKNEKEPVLSMKENE